MVSHDHDVLLKFEILHLVILEGYFLLNRLHRENLRLIVSQADEEHLSEAAPANNTFDLEVFECDTFITWSGKNSLGL